MLIVVGVDMSGVLLFVIQVFSGIGIAGRWSDLWRLSLPLTVKKCLKRAKKFGA